MNAKKGIKTHPLMNQLSQIVSRYPEINLTIVFGSSVTHSLKFESDIDLAVSTENQFTSDLKYQLTEEISSQFKRPVDIINLQKAGVILLKQILTKGIIIFQKDSQIFERYLKKMIYNNEDFLPFYRRSLKEKREKWIGI